MSHPSIGWPQKASARSAGSHCAKSCWRASRTLSSSTRLSSPTNVARRSGFRPLQRRIHRSRRHRCGGGRRQLARTGSIAARRSTPGHGDCRPVREISARRRRAPGRAVGGIEGPDPGDGAGGCFLFASAVEYPPDAPRAYDSDEYAIWGFSARRELLAPHLDVAGFSGEQVKALALTHMQNWHPALRRLVERADPGTMTTSRPNPPNQSPRGKRAR